MEIGDYVQSVHWGIEGEIQDIRPCGVGDCKRESLTLDVPGSPVRGYFHVNGFKMAKRPVPKS